PQTGGGELRQLIIEMRPLGKLAGGDNERHSATPLTPRRGLCSLLNPACSSDLQSAPPPGLDETAAASGSLESHTPQPALVVRQCSPCRFSPCHRIPRPIHLESVRSFCMGRTIQPRNPPALATAIAEPRSRNSLALKK